MPKQKLTDASLRALRPGQTQIDYWCTSFAGFGVRVSPGGRKSFMVRYRLGGRYRRVKLGVYPELSLADARRRARQVVGDVASDRDPAQARRDARLAPTFEHLANLYIEKHARVKKRSWKEDRRVINKELFPAWRAMRATEIRRRDIRTLIEKIAERPAPSMANRTQALIHKMFNFAIAHEFVEFNPCAQLEHPAKERARDRILTDAEIRQFWSVLDGEPPHLAAPFRLRLITAQRGGEVHSMRWEDIDLDGRWWTIPGWVAKNGLAHRVPLSDLAMEVLVGLRERQTTRMAASPYVLSAAARDPRRRRPTLARLGLSDFRGHDLRRTAASRMASAGCPRLVIGKVLNHAEPGVTAIYDRHTYDGEKREALQTWARSLRALVDADGAGCDRGPRAAERAGQPHRHRTGYGPVGPDALPFAFRKTVAAERRRTLAEAREDLERAMVRDALGRHGSVARAAGELGVTRQGLSKLMARLQVDRFDPGRDRSVQALSRSPRRAGAGIDRRTGGRGTAVRDDGDGDGDGG